MKHNIVLIALISLSLSVSAGGFKVKVSNAGQFDQSHLPVILKLDNYSKIHPTQRERLAVFVNGRQISSQLDDLNGDRIPDELVFQLNQFVHQLKVQNEKNQNVIFHYSLMILLG